MDVISSNGGDSSYFLFAQFMVILIVLMTVYYRIAVFFRN